MGSFNFNVWYVAILIATPLVSQATRKFPEPLRYESLCDCKKIRSLIQGNADCWMICSPSFGNPSCVYVTKEFRSGSRPGESVYYLAHVSEGKTNQAKGESGESLEPVHLVAELPPGVGPALSRAWEAILKQTRYPDPIVINGVKVIPMMVDGESFFFGSWGRYFGMNHGLVTDEAWLIQNLGTELMKFVKSEPQARQTSIERINRLLKEVESSSTTSSAQ